MIELRAFAKEINNRFNIGSEYFNECFVRFLVDNEWFGIEPTWVEEELYVNPTDFAPIMPMIEEYFESTTMSTSQKSRNLIGKIKAKYPDTGKKLEKFYSDVTVREMQQICVTSFLLKFLEKDLCLQDDQEVQKLLELSYKELPKQYGETITFFLSWLKEHYKTKYVNDYFMASRQDHGDRTSAYETEDYLQLLYYLFNEDYIKRNDMYQKAARSKNYVDTWLFLSLHFICALRSSDLVRIYHPKLTMKPMEVLAGIKENTFTDEDARLTLYSITWRLNVLPLVPNKTKKHSNVAAIKLCIPESVEVHMGKLFAIAEAHYQLQNCSEMPLVRIIRDYERINRYMGEEIGSMFLESDFRSRSANKSYLQSVFMLTDDILENNDEFNVKGYILAALARSHKGSYGEFASTTATYLRDAKFSGFTPEFVARELFERGVLSFVPSLLLKMITEGEYNKLSVSKQTELIQALVLTPNEVEQVVSVHSKAKKQSIEIVNVLLDHTPADHRRDNILSILHRIGNGNAVSKQNECLCLITAMKKVCPYIDRSNCIGCKYEISTKSTVFLLVNEYKRLKSLFNSTQDSRIKAKYRSLIESDILPVMDELLECTKEQYGVEALRSLEKIIKESVQDG